MFSTAKRAISNPGLTGSSPGKQTNRSECVLSPSPDSPISTHRGFYSTPNITSENHDGRFCTSSSSHYLSGNFTNASTYTSSTLSSVGAMDQEAIHGLIEPSNLSFHENKTKRPEITPAGADQTSLGNWGWFEDVHNESASASLRQSSSLIDTKRKDVNAQSSTHSHTDVDRKFRIGDTFTEKKNGGLLLFSYSTVRPLNDVMGKTRDTPTMAITAPNYVLEESLSSQKLWKHTAGARPPQPVEERAFYEKVWAQNFLRSEVKYQIPVEVLTASSPISLSPYADGGFSDSADGSGLSNCNIAGQFNANYFGGGGGDRTINKDTEADVAEATIMHRTTKAAKTTDCGLQTSSARTRKKVDGALSVLVKGDNVFGTTVSKSFARSDLPGRIDTISISIASYRVVESKKHGKYAQFLVVYREGSFQDTVGVWKRYSDFDALARKVTSGEESCSSLLSSVHPLAAGDDDGEKEVLPNAVTSWRLLKKRQRWYRCLDAGYLSLKVFLLERFLHDILFECANPKILRDFVGVFLQ